MRALPLLVICLGIACGAPHPLEDIGARPRSFASLEPDPELAALGEPRFQRYCASCHGTDARGNGPVGRGLRTPPPDLRRVALRNGGRFPGGEIAQKIDGRFDIAPHGTREMPVWGQAFGANVPEAGLGESIARGQIAVLVEYLHSIQDAPAPGASEPDIRKTMGEIFAAMRLLLPLSLSAEGFERPEQDAEIRRALRLLDQSSAELSRHGASDDVAFAHLSRSLAIDARDAHRRYDEDHKVEARYLVQTLTDTCVACHSRLPGGSAPRSEAFLRDLPVEDLPLARRAKLAYATRQFDAAIGLYEQILADESLPATEIDLGGHLDDYLDLALRVQRDPARAAATLGSFAARPNLHESLQGELKHWVVDLRALARAPAVDDPMQRARDLVGDLQDRTRGDRLQLVTHLEASGVLHRALESGLAPSERAEAYYLLGLIETRIGRTYWLSQAEAFLETAIRMAPGEPIAQSAYDVLEDFLVRGYSGSAGEHVPPDVQLDLDRLRWIAELPPEPRPAI